MSIIDVFYRLQKMETGMPVTFNIHEGGFELDDKAYKFPASTTELKNMLGEPRIVENTTFDDSDSIKKGIAEDYGFTLETFHPVRYYWDEYGIVGNSYDREIINNIVIFFGKSQYPIPTTKYAFGGNLLFDGQPWQDVVTKPGYNGAHRFENSLVHTAIYGKKSKAKNLKVMEWMLKTKATEELKKEIRRRNGLTE